MKKEDVVVAYIQGTVKVPDYLKRIVEEYNKRARVVETCKSYPQQVDDEMNKLYDALEVLA